MRPRKEVAEALSEKFGSLSSYNGELCGSREFLGAKKILPSGVEKKKGVKMRHIAGARD